MEWNNKSFMQKVEAFERLTIDDHAFFVFTNADDLEVHVRFKKSGTIRPWEVWFSLSADASRQSCSAKHFEAVIQAFRINANEVARTFQTHILTQAAFADQFVREVSEVMGPVLLQKSILETQNFMDALSEAVQRTLGSDNSLETQVPQKNKKKNSTASDFFEQKSTAFGDLTSNNQRPSLRIIKPTE